MVWAHGGVGFALKGRMFGPGKLKVWRPGRRAARSRRPERQAAPRALGRQGQRPGAFAWRTRGGRALLGLPRLSGQPLKHNTATAGCRWSLETRPLRVQTHGACYPSQEDLQAARDEARAAQDAAAAARRAADAAVARAEAAASEARAQAAAVREQAARARAQAAALQVRGRRVRAGRGAAAPSAPPASRITATACLRRRRPQSLQPASPITPLNLSNLLHPSSHDSYHRSSSTSSPSGRASWRLRLNSSRPRWSRPRRA